MTWPWIWNDLMNLMITDNSPSSRLGNRWMSSLCLPTIKATHSLAFECWVLKPAWIEWILRKEHNGVRQRAKSHTCHAWLHEIVTSSCVGSETGWQWTVGTSIMPWHWFTCSCITGCIEVQHTRCDLDGMCGMQIGYPLTCLLIWTCK